MNPYHALGLRTVINLRGARPGCGSDVLGREAASWLGLAHIDAPFESRGAPHKDRVLRLAEIFRTMEEPALLQVLLALFAMGLIVLTQKDRLVSLRV